MSEPNTNRKKRPGLKTWILIGLFSGLLCGLFFGEAANGVRWIGDVYVGLLQMAVLPYVAVSLIANIGGLSVHAGFRLLRISFLVLLLLWCVGIVTLVIVSMAFPSWETGSFFSTQFTEEPPAHSWLDLFIPSNPFRSLSENSIPAVVVFCIGLGIALMTLPNKRKLLEPLEVLVDALANLNRLVVKLTPLGMFGIVAYTTGTIDFDQFNLIQGYLLTYGAAALILSFVCLPALVASLTPWSFREILSATRDPLIAAFVIGNSFVVLPMIIDSIRRLPQKSKPEDELEDYLVPLAYPFPDIGRIVGLVFIPFAAWFYGQIIDMESIPALLGVGVIGSFAKPIVTIPLLLNIAELPSDIFNLFLASGVVASRFGDLMKTMHIIAFTILTMCFLNGTARIKLARFLAGMSACCLLLVLTAMLIKGYLHAEFKGRYSRENLLTERQMVFPELDRRIDETDILILDESIPNSIPVAAGETRIERIQRTGTIRIGFNPDRLPFCYYNKQGDLIGFDIQMAYYLANDLGVGIEFVPIQTGQLQHQLSNDHFDVAMSALEGTIEQAASLPAIDPYMSITLAIVVPDHKKQMFRDVETMLAQPDLKLAVIKHGYFAERAAKAMPENVSIVELDSALEYFEGRFRDVDGLVLSAESGSAWTLRWPKYTVANPVKGRVRVPLYYLTAADPLFEDFMENWMTLTRSNGTFQDLYDYWILGIHDQHKTRRWSIMHDVLGWGN